MGMTTNVLPNSLPCDLWIVMAYASSRIGRAVVAAELLQEEVVGSARLCRELQRSTRFERRLLPSLPSERAGDDPDLAVGDVLETVVDLGEVMSRASCCGC